MIRVLIADDHSGMRSAFAMMLNQQDGIHVVDDVPDGRSAVARLMQSGIDVALIDMMMPDMEGDEVIRAVMGGNGWKPRMVIYSGFVYADLVRRALDAGACGYLDKVAGIPETVTVIRAVARGEMCLCPSALEVVGEDVVAEAVRANSARAFRVSAEEIVEAFKRQQRETIFEKWPWDVRAVFEYLVSHVDSEDLQCSAMYDECGVDSKRIAPRYRKAVGYSPKRHQLVLRHTLANKLLGSGVRQADAAILAGFASAAALVASERSTAGSFPTHKDTPMGNRTA